MKDNANRANHNANHATIWANLRAIFALPKWLKIILGVLSIIAVVGIIGTLALNQSVKGETYSANLSLHEQKVALDDNKNAIDGEFSYTARIHFEKYAALLRSSSISNVKVISYAWDNSKVDSTAFKDLKHSKRNVFFNSTQDLSALGVELLGKVEYTIDFKPLLKNIAKYYFNILIFAYISLALWRAFTNLLRSLPPKNITIQPAHTLTRKDYIFLGFAFALCFGIGAFTFWLGFPGFHIIGDTYNSIALAKNNAHPVFIAYVLQGLYFIFGKNLYYLFLFNIVPFYAGIFFLIAGFYLRFKNPFAILLLFPTFIGNIYFQNFIQYHSFALPMMLFCIYSVILFLILAPLKRTKFLWILLFVLMFFAILWRHNAIFSVFPAFFIIGYLLLQNRGLDSPNFTKIYAKFMILSALLCLFIVIFIPRLLQTSQSHPANHPFLHQIAGACVPADDSSCFKDEWYYPHKKWSDVKDLYAKYPLNADPFNVSWAYDDERPFKPETLNGLKSQWIKSIAKYPSNFLAHESRFFKAMWWQNPAWIFDAKKMQEKATHEWHISATNDFKESQRSITFTPLQEQIYTFFYNHKILLNHIWGVGIGFVVLIFSSVVLWRKMCIDSAKQVKNTESIQKNLHTNSSIADEFLGFCEASDTDKTNGLSRKRAEAIPKKSLRDEFGLDSATHNNLLIFCFATSFATFFSAVFIALFTPVPETRYMSPILPMAIIALVGFVAFVLEKKSIFTSKFFQILRHQC